MLRINELNFRIAGRPLFELASATVAPGHKVGLVGRNGSGKSTLFKLITGELLADSGTVSLSGRARIGQVQQEAPAGNTSLIAGVTFNNGFTNIFSKDVHAADINGNAVKPPDTDADKRNKSAESINNMIVLNIGILF